MSLKKANITFTVKSLNKKVSNGEVVFDNAIQRRLCWSNEKKSLLIHSIIMGYPIPPLYSAKGNDDEGRAFYDMLDGKQRSNAIIDFLNDKFRLVNVPTIIDEQGNEIDINKKLFSQLDEEIQDSIRDCTLNVYYFEDITEDETLEMFYRLNNGKPLSQIELTRVKAIGRDRITSIGKEEIFTKSLTEKQIGNYTNEDIIIKSLILLYNENKSLETKNVRKIVESMDITDEMEETLKKIYERIVDIHEIILINYDSKEYKKAAKKIYTRTHLISIVPMIKKSIDDNLDVEILADIVLGFFKTDGKETTISERYNSVCQQGANKEGSVKIRLEELDNYYNESVKGL